MTMFFIPARIMTMPPFSDSPTPAGDIPPTLQLDAIEARVLGTLMEKARTVPDSYPLSLNALLLGCNQKTSRDPFMELIESDVVSALEKLKAAGLVHETSGGRTVRLTHNFQRGLGLRGPQTAAELRLNSERWYKFADISSVEGFLEELQDRPAAKGGALTIKLPKAPGAREQRWAHLLCGPVEMGPAAHAGSVGNATSLERIAKLEVEVLQLREILQKLHTELGLSPFGQE